MVSIRSIRVVASLAYFRHPRCSTREATRITDRGTARGSPRVVLVDVLVGPRGCVAVHGAVFRVIEGGLLTQPTKVNLPTSTDVIALWTPNKALHDTVYETGTRLSAPERTV